MVFARAVGAAIDLLASRNTMTDDAALAVRTAGRHVVDGAFETVIRVALTAPHHFKSMDVFVTAHFAHRHLGILRFTSDCSGRRRVVTPQLPTMLRECSYG
jgi:hypothetical protein